ncbi:MAG TPA: cytochrome c peroxidase [Kofleriaceae bacterium]|jgi:cytochrome c peroxidase
MRPRELIVGALLLAACGKEAPPAPDAKAAKPAVEASDAHRQAPLNPRILRRFRPLRSSFVRQDAPPSAALVDLGRMLYFEPRLSSDRRVSCNSCHGLDHYGVDGLRVSFGHDKKVGARNSPSTFNAAGLVAQFWDGREADVEHQVTGPLLNPVEMGETPERVVETLSSIPEYVERFQAAFPGRASPISVENVTIAIGAFERGLVTPAPWDRYLAGDTSALSSAQLEGLRVFTNVGCISCHTGELVGGSSFQLVGAVKPWPNTTDHGRMELTKNASDDMMFKVPSLRNVAMTAPYFHDGSAATLDEAIHMMGEYQLGVTLTDSERASVAAWLTSLTGTPDAAYVRAPTLPR